MSTCDECGQAIETTVIAEYKTEVFGIPLTIKNSAEQDSCACQSPEVHIPHPKKLMKSAALSRLGYIQKLNGTEIKFVRKTLGWSAKVFADKVSVDPATVSRWESNKQPMGATVEKLFRVHAANELIKEAFAVDLDLEEILGLEIGGFVQPDNFIQMSFILSVFKKDSLYADIRDEAVA